MADEIEKIGNDLAATMPTPQEHAIEAEAEPVEPELDFNSAVVTDREGNQFDPNIHSVDADGTPRLTQQGFLRRKRGKGAAAGSFVGSSEAPAADAAVAGTMVTDMIINTCRMAFGEEWQPHVDPATGMNERAAMATAWGRYLQSRGMTDIPPGIMVCCVMSMYVVPRLTLPHTQTRLEKITGWAKGKFAAWRERRRNGVQEPRGIKTL